MKSYKRKNVYHYIANPFVPAVLLNYYGVGADIQISDSQLTSDSHQTKYLCRAGRAFSHVIIIIVSNLL